MNNIEGIVPVVDILEKAEVWLNTTGMLDNLPADADPALKTLRIDLANIITRIRFSDIEKILDQIEENAGALLEGISSLEKSIEKLEEKNNTVKEILIVVKALRAIIPIR